VWSAITTESQQGRREAHISRASEEGMVGGPQSLSILEHYEALFEVLWRYAGISELQQKVEAMREVWKQYHDLVSLSKQADVMTTEDQWLGYARAFRVTFVNCFRPEDVTSPYLHVFIYHLGYFMEKFRGIEKYATFADESKTSGKQNQPFS